MNNVQKALDSLALLYSTSVFVGAVMRTTKEILNNPSGTLAVCYEAYTVDRCETMNKIHKHFSFIFPNGEYDGFSCGDMVTCFEMQVAGAHAVGYRFQNVLRLQQDFRRGVFDEAWVIDKQTNKE